MPRKSKARGKPFVEGNQNWAGNPNDEPGAGALTSECPCRTQADIRTHTRTHTQTRVAGLWTADGGEPDGDEPMEAEGTAALIADVPQDVAGSSRSCATRLQDALALTHALPCT